MIKNIKLAIETKEVLDDIKAVLGNAINEAVSENNKEEKNTHDLLKSLIEEQKIKGRDVEIRELSMAEFLDIISKEDDYEDDYEDDCEDQQTEVFIEFLKTLSNNNKCEDSLKEDSKKNDLTSKVEKSGNDTSNFSEMIEEYENGYKGFVTDGEEIYEYSNGAILIVSETGRYPADITSKLLNKIFVKEKLVINNNNALELAINGETVEFELDINSTLVTVTLSSKNGVPSYKVNNETHIVNSDLIL